MERKRPSPVGKIGWRTKGVGATIYVCRSYYPIGNILSLGQVCVKFARETRFEQKPIC